MQPSVLWWEMIYLLSSDVWPCQNYCSIFDCLFSFTFWALIIFIIPIPFLRVKKIVLGTVLRSFFRGPIWIFQINWRSYHGLIQNFRINWRICRGSIQIYLLLVPYLHWSCILILHINKRRQTNCLTLYFFKNFIICSLNTLLNSAIFGFSFRATHIPHILLHFEPFDSVLSEHDHWFLT